MLNPYLSPRSCECCFRLPKCQRPGWLQRAVRITSFALATLLMFVALWLFYPLNFIFALRDERPRASDWLCLLAWGYGVALLLPFALCLLD